MQPRAIPPADWAPLRVARRPPSALLTARSRCAPASMEFEAAPGRSPSDGGSSSAKKNTHTAFPRSRKKERERHPPARIDNSAGLRGCPVEKAVEKEKSRAGALQPRVRVDEDGDWSSSVECLGTPRQFAWAHRGTVLDDRSKPNITVSRYHDAV
eukprot:scaffold60524_cov33-Tisochrysis_lutea.AAC.3